MIIIIILIIIMITTTTSTASPSIPIMSTLLSTTTAIPSYCPYKYSDLMVKNPCKLEVCKDTSDNAECKDGIALYCNESKYVNNGEVEIGCISIGHPSYVGTTTPLPSVVGTTTSRPYVPGVETTTTTTSAVVDRYTTTTKAGRPYCPFQYFDLQYATNPCMISSCEIHNDGEVCREAVAVYCNRSMAEKGYVEEGCMAIDEIEKTPTPTTTTTIPTTTTTTSTLSSTTTAIPSYCPYKYSDLMVKNPCKLEVCKDTSDNAECKDGIALYCNESKYVNNGE